MHLKNRKVKLFYIKDRKKIPLTHAAVPAFFQRTVPVHRASDLFFSMIPQTEGCFEVSVCREARV
jgi:hypothetical protein